MDETSLREMLERAVAERPATPLLVPNSVRAGARLRKRRRIEAVVGSFAAVALIAAIVPAAAGEFRPPQATAGSPGTGTAYVWDSTGNAGTVIPVLLGTGSKLAPLTFPGQIQAVEAAPGGKVVYVFSVRRTQSTGQSQSGTGFVTAINNASGKAGHPIRLTGGIDAAYDILTVQIAPYGKFAYAEVTGPGSNGALEAINLMTGAQQHLATPRSSTNGTVAVWAIAPDGRIAYAAGSNSEVLAVDLTTGTALPPIKVRAPGFVDGFTFAPDGRTVYAASVSNLTKLSRDTTWITPISTATNVAARPIEVQNAAVPPQMAIAPDGQTGYVIGGPGVEAVRLATGRALEPITIAGQIDDFEVSPTSKVGYAWQLSAHAVQLVNLTSGDALWKAELPGGYRQAGAGFFAPGGSTLYVPAIYRSGPTTRSALFPVQIATQHVGRPILLAGNIQETVFIP